MLHRKHFRQLLPGRFRVSRQARLFAIALIDRVAGKLRKRSVLLLQFSVFRQLRTRRAGFRLLQGLTYVHAKLLLRVWRKDFAAALELLDKP